jgi:hypothetical protein
MFRHPLVRSAVYWSAAMEERWVVHLALAEATDRDVDPDRRAWHLAAAATGPDEGVALELERSAGRAQARGGVAATAAFLQRAVALGKDPSRRADRALAAAEASLQVGAFDTALRLVTTAEVGALDEFRRGRADLVRAHVAFISFVGSDAPALLLKAARRLEPFDLELARETYLTAWGAADIAAHLAGEDVRLETCHAVPERDDSGPERLCAGQFKRRRRALSEQRCAVAYEYGVDRELELVEQAVLRECRSERPVAVDEQILSALLLHPFDLGRRVAADGRGVIPVRVREGRGEHVLADRVDRVGVATGLVWPEAREDLMGSAAHEHRVAGP